MATNLPTYYLKPAAVRSAEVPDADWVGGMNRGASNAVGIGIATAVQNPKPQDWARIADNTTTGRFSEHLGHVGSPIRVVRDGDVTDEVAFVEADAETAADASLDATTGAVNRAGGTVADEAWIWGVIPKA